jgi:Uma2 family endonuclease
MTTTELDLPVASEDAEGPLVVVPGKEMTAEEFEKWAMAQELARCEWVEGKVIVMAPVSLWHNNLNRWLVVLFSLFVDDRDLGVTCYDVYFRMPGRRRIPDIFVVKKENLARVTPTALDGPADLAMEIVSPDSGPRDWREKYLEYESAGVGEYWVIDPATQVVECYTMGTDRQFHPNVAKDDKIASAVLPGFYLRPSWLWQKPLPRVAGVLREMGVAL